MVFDANGGQSAPATQIVRRGQDATLTSVLPQGGGLAFRGWATEPDAAVAAYQPGDTVPYEEGTSYVVLYALWELSPVARPVRVDFDANGGLPDTVPDPAAAPIRGLVHRSCGG